MPVLDAMVLVHLENRDHVVKDVLDQLAYTTLVVPPVVAAEYLTGCTDQAAALADLRQGFTIPAAGDEWILCAAALRRQLHAQKALVRIPDLWIGAWARLLKTYVVTANARHFRAMGIAAWHYPTEEKPPK